MKRGGKAVACIGSVVAEGFADNFIQTALDNFGCIASIVNNGGYAMDAMLGKITDEQFDSMDQVHLKAPFQILRAAAGGPAEDADAVYLFCCPESNYVSGQTLVCGGGLSL